MADVEDDIVGEDVDEDPWETEYHEKTRDEEKSAAGIAAPSY
jgi:hypothetical protein